MVSEIGRSGHFVRGEAKERESQSVEGGEGGGNGAGRGAWVEGGGLRCGLEGQDWTFCRWFSSFLSWFAIGQNRRRKQLFASHRPGIVEHQVLLDGI